MVITAWIIFITIVGLMMTHILLYKKNDIYHNKINMVFKKKWVIIAMIPSIFILLYAVATSFLIMIQGDCFVGYYSVWNYKDGMIYYNDSQYNMIFDKELQNKAYEYGAGEWEYTDTYIIGDEPIGFPYIEYWCPKFIRNELILPGELEPIYIRVHAFGSGTVHYIRHDMLEE